MLIMSSPSLRKCLAKVVDNGHYLFEEKIFGEFLVESPETLKETTFDYLLIGSVHYRDEITHIVKNKMMLNVEILDL